MAPGPGKQAGAGTRQPAARRVRDAVSGVRRWQVWALRPAARLYVLGMIFLAAGVAAVACARTSWQASHLALAAALLACSFIANEASRRIAETHGEISRDLSSLWLLPAAILLPPAYVLVMPFLVAAYKITRIPSSRIYRRIFSGATMSLAYGGASVAFHAFPASVAGSDPDGAGHALTWAACVIGCGLAGTIVHNGLLTIAIKLSDPAARIRDLTVSKESARSDGIELSVAVIVTLVVAINWVLVFLTLPAVLLYKRSAYRAQLTANARLDAGTGLLNAAAWRREAEFSISRVVRDQAPLAIAMVSLDDFAGKPQQLTIPRVVRDQLIRQVAATLTGQLPGDSLVGRLGDEEFAIVLPGAGAGDAKRVAERLRAQITAVPFEVDAGEASYVFRLTVSVGIAVLNESRAAALDELVEAADTALGQARAAGGRIRVAASAAEAS